MKKLNKVLCLVIAFAMLLQVSAFALGTTHITFTESETDENGVKTVTVNTLAGGVGDDDAKLLTAVYDASGNVVSGDEAATDGKNALLGNTVEVKEGQTVKSFVWTKNDHTPIEAVATMGEAINPEDVEITFDGVDFETFMGEALAFDESHTTEYHISYENRDEVFTPDVSVKVKKNSLRAVVEKEDLMTTIKIYGGNRIAVDDPTNAGKVTNINGEEKNKWVYNVNNKEHLDQSYEWPLCETIIIHYDGEGDTSYWTEEEIISAGDVGVWHTETVDNIASKKYIVAEGETKAITLSITTPSELTNFVVVKAKDNTKDVLVNEDGSAITWTTSNPASTSNAFNGASAYNYRLKADGSRDFSLGYEASRATGVEFCNTAITATATDASRKVYYGRNTQNSDGDYISGSVLSWERNPIPGGNRMEYTDIPEEYLGENYLAMPKAALKDLTFTIHVNDNIDSIVMFAADNNGRYKTSQFSIKDSEDAASWEFTSGNDYGERRYQNSVTVGTYSYLTAVGYDASKEIIAGRYVRYNFLKEIKAKYGCNVFKLNTSSAYVNAAAFNTGTTANYSANYHEDFKTIGNREVKKLINNYRTEYDAYVDYYNNVYTGTNALLTEEYMQGTINGTIDLIPSVSKFGPLVSAFNDRTGFAATGGTGGVLRYPDYFNLENAEFVATNLNWQNTTSSYTEYIKDTKNYGNPVFSFDLGRDATVMVMYINAVKDGSPLSASGNQGWSHFTLPSEDAIHVMEKSISWPTEAARPAIGTCFVYDEVYTKQYKKGETFTLPTPGGSCGAPLVFVWEIDDIPHTVNATDIKVNGVSLDGFDSDILEYNYTLSEAEVANPKAPVVTVTTEDATADVEVVYDKTFPGGATVTISHYTGISKSYKINFVNNIDMVYDIVMCNDNKYQYTALKEVTDTAAGETTTTTIDYTVSFTDAAMGSSSNTIAEYVKGGVKVGEHGYTDRAYLIKSIGDESYAGKDRIVGAISWYNGAQTMKTAFNGAATSNTVNGIKTVLTPQGETYIPNWLNFKTKRGATVKVCCYGYGGNYANLERSGFYQEADTTARFIIDINGKDREQKYICAKSVEAATTVSVPNANTGDSAYSVVLFYNDWE